MNSAGTWVAGVWALLLGGAVALGTAAFARLDRADPRASWPTALPPERLGGPYPADSLGVATVARDPFRVTRRAAEVAYDPVRLDQVAAAPRVSKPVLTLVGLVAGAEPTAIVVGLPGVEGPRVMRVGDQVARITLKAIARQEVRLEGMDTTWVLRVREP
jgi:hypothetical protein